MNFDINTIFSWLDSHHVLLYFAVITALHLVFLMLFRLFSKGEQNLTRTLTLRDAALKINRSFMQTEDTQSLLDMMILTAVSLVNKGTQGTIMLSEQGVMRVSAQVGFEESIFDNLQIPIEETLIYKHTGGDLSHAVIMEGDRHWAQEDSYLVNIKSMMSAPVISNGQLYATINLYSSAHRKFTFEDLMTIEYLAEQVKGVLEKQNQYEETLKNAQIDSLTGLCNRRHSLAIIDKIVDSKEVSPEDLCLLLLDIDNLKPVNDHYGHDLGDLLIQGFANALQVVFKDSICIGRYGGDEFVVCLDLKNQSLELALADYNKQLKQYLGKHLIRVATEAISIEYSAGAARLSESGLDIKNMIQLADQRMYQGKEAKKSI